MIYQSKPFSCGPASLHNACNYVMGDGAPSEDVFRAQVAEFGDQTDGTDYYQMKAALDCHDIQYKTFSERHANGGLVCLDKCLEDGHAVIVYGNLRDHWFVVIGKTAGYYTIIDSADSDLVLRYSQGKLLAEWGGEKGRHRFYGIAI